MTHLPCCGYPRVVVVVVVVVRYGEAKLPGSWWHGNGQGRDTFGGRWRDYRLLIGCCSQYRRSLLLFLFNGDGLGLLCVHEPS